MSARSVGGHRALLVAASNRRRGAEVYTRQLADGLDERGWSTDPVCLTRVDGAATVELEPLSSLSPESAGRANKTILRALRRHVRVTKPDVIVAMGGSTLRYAVASNLPRVAPLAYFAIGEPRYWLRSSVALAVNRLLLARVDHVIAVSRVTADQLQEISPRLRNRISVAYTGVEGRFYRASADSPDAAGPFRVVVVGSLSPEKDPLLALRSVEDLDRVELRFVGDGPLRESVEAETQRLGVGDRVSLVGAVEEVLPQLEWADVLLLTSRTEGLPGVVLEAAAAGVPTVGVDVGGVGEAVENGVTGLMTGRDVDQIRSALTALRDDPDTLRSMGQAARKRALAIFSLDRATGRFSVVLEDVVA